MERVSVKPPRKLYCANCGEDMGIAGRFSYPGDVESCGKQECNSVAREIEREREDDARERAQEDGYERYR